MTDPSIRKILLTGATGFLGPYVSAALRAQGWSVRAALQRPSSAPLDCEAVIVGSIGGTTEWRAALLGIEAVVHLAGRAHWPPAVQQAERELYFETNTAATLHLAQVAAAAGVRHFVFASSVAVNGATTDGRGPFRESDPPSPQTVYGATKAAAEAGLAEIATQTGMAVTAIRPPMIYGRHAKGSFRTLSRAIGWHIPLPFGLVQNQRAFVAAENVASFITFRLAQPVSGFNAYIVADDEQVSTAEFCRRIARALGTKALLLPVPRGALALGLRAVGATNLIESTLGSLVVDTAKVRSTGWRPAVTLNEGLRRAMEEPEKTVGSHPRGSDERTTV
jgi:UDP-glucose 4-epimerase